MRGRIPPGLQGAVALSLLAALLVAAAWAMDFPGQAGDAVSPPQPREPPEASPEDGGGALVVDQQGMVRGSAVAYGPGRFEVADGACRITLAFRNTGSAPAELALRYELASSEGFVDRQGPITMHLPPGATYDLGGAVPRCAPGLDYVLDWRAEHGGQALGGTLGPHRFNPANRTVLPPANPPRLALGPVDVPPREDQRCLARPSLVARNGTFGPVEVDVTVLRERDSAAVANLSQTLAFVGGPDASYLEVAFPCEANLRYHWELRAAGEDVRFLWVSERFLV